MHEILQAYKDAVAEVLLLRETVDMQGTMLAPDAKKKYREEAEEIVNRQFEPINDTNDPTIEEMRVLECPRRSIVVVKTSDGMTEDQLTALQLQFKAWGRDDLMFVHLGPDDDFDTIRAEDFLRIAEGAKKLLKSEPVDLDIEIDPEDEGAYDEDDA